MPSTSPRARQSRLLRTIWGYRSLYLMLLPGLLYFLIFRYGPLWNAQIAFKDFRPLLGVEGSPWVGFDHFLEFFRGYYFSQLLTNTILISVAKLVFGIFPAIFLALAIHETSKRWLGRFAQTVSYLPHFLSWIVVFGVLLAMLSPSQGLINEGIKNLGRNPINFLTDPNWFRTILVGSDIWKETGWGAILYLAALIGIDPVLYEAAAVDGASRWQRIRHISFPGLLEVLILVTLLRLGSILDAGFQQIFATYSLPVYGVADVIDTWVYRQGIQNFQFSLATAVGLFKGLIGLVLILVANRLARRFANSSLY